MYMYVQQYIRATFLLSTCHSCVHATALKLKSSHNATMAFVSYAYYLVMASYNVHATDINACRQ